jgi:hypothetical protein
MTILLLFGSNVFMTFAWYGHLKYGHDWPLWKAILVSWGIALIEYQARCRLTEKNGGAHAGLPEGTQVSCSVASADSKSANVTEARLPRLRTAIAVSRNDGREQVDHKNDEQHDAVQDNGSSGAQRNCRSEERQNQ